MVKAVIWSQIDDCVIHYPLYDKKLMEISRSHKVVFVCSGEKSQVELKNAYPYAVILPCNKNHNHFKMVEFFKWLRSNNGFDLIIRKCCDSVIVDMPLLLEIGSNYVNIKAQIGNLARKKCVRARIRKLIYIEYMKYIKYRKCRKYIHKLYRTYVRGGGNTYIRGGGNIVTKLALENIKLENPRCSTEITNVFFDLCYTDIIIENGGKLIDKTIFNDEIVKGVPMWHPLRRSKERFDCFKKVVDGGPIN